MRCTICGIPRRIPAGRPVDGPDDPSALRPVRGVEFEAGNGHRFAEGNAYRFTRPDGSTTPMADRPAPCPAPAPVVVPAPEPHGIPDESEPPALLTFGALLHAMGRLTPALPARTVPASAWRPAVPARPQTSTPPALGSQEAARRLPRAEAGQCQLCAAGEPLGRVPHTATHLVAAPGITGRAAVCPLHVQTLSRRFGRNSAFRSTPIT